MYYIAVKDGKDNYYIEQAVENWHEAVDGFEPIDCIDGEMVIYIEDGHKYLVGPHKDLEKKKLFWKIHTVDVGQWDFSKGEPFLIDTKEVVPDELEELLKGLSNGDLHD